MAGISPSRHVLFGLHIDSPFALPSAPLAADDTQPPELRILWAAPPDFTPRSAAWAAQQGAAHQFRAEAAKDGRLIAAWPGRVSLSVNAGGSELRIACADDVIPNMPEIVTGLGMGLVLHARGILALHGNVLRGPRRTIAILGDSGAGKSTLTAALVQRGAALVSDDITALVPGPDGQFRALRGPQRLRLNPDSAAALGLDSTAMTRTPHDGKLGWDLRQTDMPDPAPRLDALYWLHARPADAGIAIKPIPSNPDKLRVILGAWFPPSCSALMSGARMKQAGSVAQSLPLHSLRYHRSWATLDDLAQALDP